TMYLRLRRSSSSGSSSSSPVSFSSSIFLSTGADSSISAASASAFSASVSWGRPASVSSLPSSASSSATALPAFLAFPAAGLLPEPLRAPVVVDGRLVILIRIVLSFRNHSRLPWADEQRFSSPAIQPPPGVSVAAFRQKVWLFVVARRTGELHPALWTRPRDARRGGSSGLDPGGGQSLAGGGAVRRADAVRPPHRPPAGHPKQT